MKKLLTILFAVALGLNLSAQVPDYVPTEGLVAWYPLNGDVLDIGPTGMNGVNYGAQCDENRNQIPCEAMSFTAGDYLSVPADSSFTSQEGTMTGWVKLNSYAQSGASGYNHFFNRWEVNSHEFVFAANIYGLYIYVENELFQSDTLPNLNEWHHLAFSYSSISGMAKIYIDGQNIAEFEGVDTVTPTNHPLHIGGNPFVPAYNSVDGSMDDVGIWERTLELSEISALYNAQLPVPGCTDSIACNFNEEATSDDGSCIPSGCMEAEACNYNALAECEGEACDYTCCPGPGCCSAGMYWDYDLEQCLNYETCQEDLDGDGVIGINDLMELLSSFGTMCEEPETVEFTCGDPMNYHGYDYATVQIGEQCWFAENLRGESYSDGEAIPTDLSDSEWAGTAEGAVSVYDGDMANLSAYGRLYNWYAVEDSRGLCPSGWHIPSDGEFIMLELELGMSEDETNGLGWRGTNQGIQLKSNFGWWAGGNGDDSIGFTALPGGNRLPSGGYNAALTDGNWWTSSSSESQDGQRMERNLDYNRDNIGRGNQPSNFGFSVRCIKD